MKLSALLFGIGLMIVGLTACNDDKPKPSPDQPKPSVNVPQFDPNIAYSLVEKQVSFGPRIPGSAAQTKCAAWMADTLKGLGAKVTVQTTTVKTYDGKSVPCHNIIAAYNPENTNRIMFCAHWDTRPFSDQDPDASKQKLTFDGADDGGSGVGILMEVARCLKNSPVTIGVDLILFDAEDWGPNEKVKMENSEDFWCLGSQYWSRNPHVAGYKARYGVLLDMTGAKDARFPKESNSIKYNPALVGKFWAEASAQGFGNYFPDENYPGGITDDHVPVSEIGHVPCIDIISLAGSSTHTFGAHWHTQSDNMKVISKSTLKAVGQTILGVIYKEKDRLTRAE